jgi:hypothetical protein
MTNLAANEIKLCTSNYTFWYRITNVWSSSCNSIIYQALRLITLLLQSVSTPEREEQFHPDKRSYSKTNTVFFLNAVYGQLFLSVKYSLQKSDFRTRFTDLC